MAWYDTGQAAVQHALSRGRNPSDFRFFLKASGEATVAFCDGDNTSDDPILHFREHVFDTRGNKAPSYSSCGGPGCPLCRAGLVAYDAWPFTIVQIKPTWTDRENKEHRNEKRLMVVKKEMMQRVLRHIEQRGGLAGTIWTLFRSSKKSYTVGDDWQFQEKIAGGRKGLAKHLGVDDAGVAPINYREDLKPKTQEDLDAMGADIEATKRREDDWAARDRAEGGRDRDRGGDRGGSGGGDRGGSGGGDRGGSGGGERSGGGDRDRDRGAGVRY